jgi:hypothetical protein
MFHDWSPTLWLLLAAGTALLALAVSGLFSIIWVLTHSD